MKVKSSDSNTGSKKKTKQNNILEKVNFHRETGARKDWHCIPLSSALILVQFQ